MQDGYVRWEDGKPVDWRLREWVRTDQLPIFRDTLPDADKIGESDDPWSYCLLLAMKDEDGELVKFSTGSVGGTNAVRRCFETGSGNAISILARCRSWRSARAATSTRFTGPKLRSRSSILLIGTIGTRRTARALPSYTTADDPRTQVRDEIDDDLPF